jgi:AcrR family transcriptional regulator
VGISERKEREKHQRRNDIIDAAEKLFFSKGFASSTMDEVAKEAEYSKGTLYLYFKSKEDLYLAITVRGMKILEQLFKEALKSSENGLCKTRKMGETYFDFAHKYPNYFNAMVYFESSGIKIDEETTSAKTCEEQGKRTLQPVAEAVQEGIKDQSIRADLDPLQVATVLWAHCTGVITVISQRGKHIEENHGVNVSDLIDLSFEMIGRSLKK